MTTFREMAADDLEYVILNTDEMAEPATYFPKTGGKRGITILEMFRQAEQEEDDFGKYLVHKLMVLVMNHATKGITEPDAGDSLVLNRQPLLKWDFLETSTETEDGLELVFHYKELLRVGKPNRHRR